MSRHDRDGDRRARIPVITRRRLVILLSAAATLMLCGVAAVVAAQRDGAADGRSPVAFAAQPSPAAAAASTAPASAAPASSGVPDASVAPSGRAGPAPSAAAKTAAGPGPARGVATPLSAKKGVSTWYFDGVGQALADVRASWYYNWAAGREKTTGPTGVEFVPMIWGANSVTPATLDLARKQGRALLGFNEPDFATQSNLSAAQALDLWPQLMATGLRLGSPAPATGAATPGGWLDQFMSGAAARGYRVDFIALHWYGSDFSPAAVNHLREYLQATYDRYHKPIWLTEYALIKFGSSEQYPTPEQQSTFVRASTAMMDGLPFVERYAWFSLPTREDGAEGTGLYRSGTTPTAAGAAYRAAGAPA
jgi:hypothetical protein